MYMYIVMTIYPDRMGYMIDQQLIVYPIWTGIRRNPEWFKEL